MKLQEFSFDLPQELIAQTPLKDRSASRLLVLDKKTSQIEHKHFSDIIDYLEEGDCLVINNTKVIPARLIGERENTGAKVEILLLTRKDKNVWETLVKPGRKAKEGDIIVFGNGLLKAKILSIVEDGNRLVEFIFDGIFEEILDKLGQMPLPPYITEKLEDKSRYQTVYAKYEGSAAAPTAGLHFTMDLLKAIEAKGIVIAYVTLHVGLGTFRPVKVENIETHNMHSEFYSLTQEDADKINMAKQKGKRVVAVGTTSVRTLETIADKTGSIAPASGWTNIFIYPGYTFKIVDAIITNFHLSESTLLMLVSAFADKDTILQAYHVAIEEKYRFFSFGDAMFIK